MSLSVADCLIPQHVIYFIYQALGLIYGLRS
nr:MAG TPA: Multidrug efflux pump-associated protein AcrZ [Bacteriophage sp.]